MALQHPVRPTNQGQGDTLERLVRERGLARFAFFLLSGEGTRLPDGSEELSGYVIDERGRVFSFWLSWDEELGEPFLSEWEAETPESHWTENAEYRRARGAVGLAAT
jgi:hypothetical protein